MWMVRAGVEGYLFEEFKNKKVVAMGLTGLGSVNKLTREEIISKIGALHPNWRKMRVAIWAGQMYRFSAEMKTGDRILTYDPARRMYLVGSVTGKYSEQEDLISDHPSVRKVSWDDKEILRDELQVATKNSLGAISTLFLLADEAAADVERALLGASMPDPADSETDQEIEEENIFQDMEVRAFEFAKDRVARLDWEEMQHLVAGLLRAMGYKTRVSPRGPDRGKDIIASPDGLGLENPRIVVEVKHQRTTSIGAPDIRSFLGGRQPHEIGLYVSTGGFTKEAHLEAERAAIPLTLVDLDYLVRSVLEHYEKMDVEAQRLLALKKLYLPI